MCGQHNMRASAGDNTGQNTKGTHPIPGQKLKFLTPQGIELGPPRLEGRDSTNHATATDSFEFTRQNFHNLNFKKKLDIL